MAIDTPEARAAAPSTAETQGAPSRPRLKYYDLVMAAFVTVILCSNLIGPAKVCTIGGTVLGIHIPDLTFGAGILFFPISYLFGDILTEVYGYKRARKVVWAGFAALAFASLMTWVVLTLPPASGWNDQAAYETVLGQTPRIVAASLLAFWAGEFVNSYVLAKLKVFSEGRLLWVRTIGSTIAGEGVDTLVFYPLAFMGLWEPSLLLKVMLTNYAVKVLWEAVATPVTYRIVNFLKRVEHEDYFDRNTDFTPFSLET